MDIKLIHDGMLVVINARAVDHPLHGQRAEVIMVTYPLPDPPPRTLQDASMAQVAHLINSNIDDEGSRHARAFRKESLETPFAWPKGQVVVRMLVRDPRPWPFPYVTVSPDDVRPA